MCGAACQATWCPLLSGEATAWLLKEFIAGHSLEYLERTYKVAVLRQQLEMFVLVWLQYPGPFTRVRCVMALEEFHRAQRVERDPLIERQEAEEQAKREEARIIERERLREAKEEERRQWEAADEERRRRLTVFEARAAMRRRHPPSEKARQVAQQRKEPLGILQRSISSKLRTTLIMQARINGKTLKAIGEEWGISGSRVHDIIAQEKYRAERWLPPKRNLGRPIDMGGPRDQWLEFTLENNAGH